MGRGAEALSVWVFQGGVLPGGLQRPQVTYDIDTSQLIENSTMWWRGANAIRIPGPEQTTMSWLGEGDGHEDW